MKEVSAPAVELLWGLSTPKHSTNTTTNGECLGELSRDIGPISDLVSMRTPGSCCGLDSESIKGAEVLSGTGGAVNFY